MIIIYAFECLMLAGGLAIVYGMFKI